MSAFAPGKDPSKWRKVKRKAEHRGDKAIFAVPKGSQRAARGSQWLKAVRDHPDVGLLRADARHNLLRVARALLSDVRPRSMTTSPGWDHLHASLGDVDRRTIGRHVRRLRQLGLLGVVHTGRTAQAAVKSSGELKAERAVYVLAVPSTLRSVETGPRAVDINVPPTPEGLRSNPLHAREDLENKQFGPASPAETLSGPAPEGVADAPKRNRQQHICSLRATIAQTTRAAAREGEKLAVAELMEHVPALRKARPAFLAWVCRPFFVAGWTAADILHAIDHRPDSTRIPHDGADGVADLARWVGHRLSFWQTSGGPRRSQSQRIAAEQAQLHAERIAAWERRQRETHMRRGPAVEGDSPDASAAKAEIRRILNDRANRSRMDRFAKKGNP
ncbi:hypothetical protein ACKVM7_000162 [Arthrobacter russicus]|uniref:hypothetical protein n=1 Tax=Arthrobacter russicus TaxID=172040 RepID=UPI003CF6208D